MKLYPIIMLIILISPLKSFSQLQKGSGIEVKGEATLKVKPDLTVVNISFSSIHMVFNKAVKDVNDKNETLLKQLEKSGFKKEEIKSSNFTAGKNTFWRLDRSIDSGYVATQSVIVEFAYDKDRVTKLVESFSTSTIGLEFNFTFILSEAKRKEVTNKLIELSILDAKSKAELIAKTSATKLSSIQSIQYGSPDFIHNPEGMFKTMDTGNANPAGFGGLNVVDVEVSDSLIIVWNITP